MNHVFKNLPFYLTTPYLTKAKTLNFILWDPLKLPINLENPPQAQKIQDPIVVQKSILEELRLSNKELEQVLEETEEPVVTHLTLNRTLQQEYKDPSNSLILLTCLPKMKLLSMT